MENRCLYIVDLQKGFMKDAVWHLPGIVENLQKQYAHVVASCFYNPPVSPYRDHLGMEKMNAGMPDTELAFKLKEGGIGVYKCRYSGGSEPDFTNYLKDQHIHAVDVCGVNTEACVLMTAASLFEQHYDVRILGYASGSALGSEYHEAGLLAAESILGKNRVIRKAA